MGRPRLNHLSSDHRNRHKMSKRMWVVLRLAVLAAVLLATTRAEEAGQKRALDAFLERLEEALESLAKYHKQIEVPKTIPRKIDNKEADISDNFQIQKSQMAKTSAPVRGRREAQEEQVKVTRVSRKGSKLKLSWVEPVSSYRNRRTLSSTAIPYNHTICYAFAPNYTEPAMMTMFKRTLAYISSRLCVDFLELKATIVISDPNWASNNGCPYNSYLVIDTESGCSAMVGSRNNGKPASIVSPCRNPYVALHEMIHVLGGIHSQQSSDAVQITSVNNNNIIPDMLYSYMPEDNAYGLPTNAYSTMMYSYTSWSINGDPTYQCMRPDRCIAWNTMSYEFTIFVEFNILYNCADYACSGMNINCYPGIVAKIDGICGCFCPDNLDPKTNCSSFLNGPNSKTTWPTYATVMAGNINNTCPSGMSATGWMGICGTALGDNGGPIPFPTENAKITYIPFCTTTSVESTDLSTWPFGGNFCFIKNKTQTCDGVFNLYTFQYSNVCPVTMNGTVGDITMSGPNTTINMCCKQDLAEWTNDFPNNQPFRVWTKYDCPYVRGMKGYNYRPYFKVANAAAYGGNAVANNYITSWGFYWDVCMMTPPSYGCSQNFSLGIATRNGSYNSPGYPTGRTPSIRCFICGMMGVDGFIRVTLTNVDTHSDDDLLMNRYSPWLDNSRIDTSNPPKDIISDGGFICLEYWSSWQKVTNAGISLTMDTILAGEVCYNYSSNGADYIGKKNVSEYGEPCVDWAKTLDCYESPNTAVDTALGYYEKNYCRNPGGKHHQPFCLTANCVKRYCDVCDFQKLADITPTSVCMANIASNPTFCTTATQRYTCALSCNFTTTSQTSCPANYIPYGTSRCLYYTTSLYNRTGAQALCAKTGPNGTLFQVRSRQDSDYLQQYRFGKASNLDTWIDGQQNGTQANYVHGSSNTSLMYTNFSSDINPYSLSGGCVALYRNTGTTINRQGAFWAYLCNDLTALLTVACQVDRAPACGQPIPPTDGIILESPKPSYYDGDRVTVQCKYSSNQPYTKYMMCKGGSWTTLNYVCSQCPAGWLLYENRCTKYITTTYTPAQAEANCNAQGPNGTLFRYTQAADHEYAKNLRNIYGDGLNDMVHINGIFQSKGKPVYSGTSTPIPYLNMTNDAIAACVNQSVIYLYRNYSTSGKQNSNICTKSANIYYSICQMDAFQIPSNDRYAGCQNALAMNARYCLDPEGVDMCPLSCGVVGNRVNCSAPVSSTYTLTSAYATVGNGESMTFACVNGTFQTSGDLIRACGLGGQLLGQEPVCVANPSSIVVGRELMTNRVGFLYPNAVTIFNITKYRVPCSGKISTWYCLTQTNNTFYLLVYRFNGTSYTLVGSNQMNCYPNTAWTVNVPAAQQISVQQGDMIGMYSPNYYTLQMTDCGDYPDDSWIQPYAVVTSFSLINSANFTSTMCVRPSFAYEVTLPTGTG